MIQHPPQRKHARAPLPKQTHKHDRKEGNIRGKRSDNVITGFLSVENVTGVFVGEPDGFSLLIPWSGKRGSEPNAWLHGEDRGGNKRRLDD